jgi:hypothetical protein
LNTRKEGNKETDREEGKKNKNINTEIRKFRRDERRSRIRE